MKKYPVRCPITAYECVMDGHWKPIIVWDLRNGGLRFKELLELLVDISTKVLTDQLKELEEDEIVIRTSYRESPPRVEYSLTEYGRTLIPVLATLREWGFKHLQQKPALLVESSPWVNRLNEPLGG